MDLQTIKANLNKKSEEVFKKLGMKCEVFNDNIYSTCPVHENSDNPRAFSFSPDKGIWKCWTRDCQHQYKNDIFGLIRGALSKENGHDVGFSEALKWSCGFLKIRNNTKKQEEKPEIENINEDFVNIVDIVYNKSEESIYKPLSLMDKLDIPSKYFMGRGFKSDTLKHFGVGDCTNPESKLYDRAIIPIHDDNGNNVVAVIGRTIKEYKSPKFLFYPKGFVKTGLFYNYHRAIDSIRRTNTVFITEGQGDVWKLYEAGIFNAISIFGKSLSKEQEEKLLKLPLTHIIVLTDNDQAGREAKTQIQRQVSRLYKLSFPKMPTKDVGEMEVDQIHKIILPQIKGKYA
jgi:5S rRNA maturation endonuclease (ribonuclease M5)